MEWYEDLTPDTPAELEKLAKKAEADRLTKKAVLQAAILGKFLSETNIQMPERLVFGEHDAYRILLLESASDKSEYMQQCLQLIREKFEKGKGAEAIIQELFAYTESVRIGVEIPFMPLGFAFKEMPVSVLSEICGRFMQSTTAELEKLLDEV